MGSRRLVSIRRRLQQVKHCVEEALEVVERKEDVRCAADDLLHAQELLKNVLPEIQAQARGWDRGSADDLGVVEKRRKTTKSFAGKT